MKEGFFAAPEAPRRAVFAAIAAAALSVAQAAEVQTRLDPFIVSGRGTPLGGEGGSVVEVNVPLARRIALEPGDIKEASFEVVCDGAADGSELSFTPERPAGGFAEKPVWRAKARGGRFVFSDGVAEELRKWCAGSGGNARLLAEIRDPGGAPAAAKLRDAVKGRMSVLERPKKLLFDAPVKIKPGVYAEMRDGRLYYDGKRLRLWSQVKDGDGARFRQLGMNGWRAWFAGDFYDAESSKRGEAMKTSKGDGSKLDRFDAMFASMKENDVFVMFATLIGFGMDLKSATSEGSWLHAKYGSAPDWDEWRAAVLALGGDAHLASYFDDRLWEARLRHAKNVLTHLNPYTGRTYAEDEAIVLVEINNEAMHLRKWMDGGFSKYPAYFRDRIENLWKRYEAARPGATRQKFYMDLIDLRNRQYVARCRSFAPAGKGVAKVAFSCDSIYRASAPWLWADAQGDSSTVSMYFWQNGTMLASPPGFYVLDSHRLDGKMNVIYETGRGRPSRYRAETPYALAVMCDWQDFDIVDWHGSWSGDASPEEILGWRALPPSTSHYWDGVHLEADPVMRSAVAMAGRLYLSGAIGTAPDPAVFTLGPGASHGRDAWNGIGGGGTSRLTFTRGTKIRFDPAQKESVLVDGRRLERVEAPSGPVKTGRYATWDWQNERLIVDAPSAKVYVGRVCDAYEFSDGVTLSGLDVPWVAFSIISRDGKPLATSASSAWISAVADARNTGFDYDETVAGGPQEQAKAVRDRGRAPVVVDPVSYTLSFPRRASMRYDAYDFALREAGSRSFAGGNTLRLSGQTDFLGVVTFRSRGGAAEPERDPSPGARRAAGGAATAAASAERTDPSRAAFWCPLPDISWGDSHSRAHRLLRDSGMSRDSVSPADLSGAARKTVVLKGAVFAMDMPATVELRYENEWLSSVSVEFEQTPDYAALVDELKRRLGEPLRDRRTGNAFEQSEAEWAQRRGGRTLRTKAFETQGVVRMTMNLEDR